MPARYEMPDRLCNDMTFVARKKIDLSFVGEGWEAAYITMTPFTFDDNAKLLSVRSAATMKNQQEARKVADDLMELVQGKFIEGKGYNGKELEPITKENIGQLPMEIINHVLQVLQGTSALPPNV